MSTAPVARKTGTKYTGTRHETPAWTVSLDGETIGTCNARPGGRKGYFGAWEYKPATGRGEWASSRQDCVDALVAAATR